MQGGADSGKGAAPEGRNDGAAALEEIRFRVPAVWKRELQRAADVQAIDLADVMRIITRGFLREKYTSDEQRRLGLV